MDRLRRFLRLPNSDRWLLVKVTCLLGATRVALKLLPFQTVYRYMNRSGQPVRSSNQRSMPDAVRISGAVNKAGRYFLGEDSCFPQALVGEMLLKRSGFPATLRIGVVKDEDGSLHAHAWVERDGKVVIGGPIHRVEKYTPLPDLDNLNR